jgi:Kef-type K+ transport system membrane component KefB
VPDDPARQSLLFLVQVGVLLFTAVVLGRLAVRLRLPAITGELLAGVLLGPSVAGALFSRPAAWLPGSGGAADFALDMAAQIGVLLLVGIAGAQLDPAILRRRPAAALSVGVAGLLVPLLLGAAAGWWLPATLIGEQDDRIGLALFMGAALSVSAIPVLAKTLSDTNLLHRDVGQLALAAAAVDAGAVWLLLSLAGGLTTDEPYAAHAIRSAEVLTGFVLLAAFAGRPLTRVALRWTARVAEPELTVATAVLIVLLAAAAAGGLGLEPLFGAFIAGTLIGSATAQAETRPQTLDPARLAPLRIVVLGVLAPIFLATAGLRVDIRALGDPLVIGITGAVLAVAMIGKFAGAYVGARLCGLGHWEGMALGAGLNARGTVEIVVATVGQQLGLLSATAYTVLVLVAVVTSMIAPPLLRIAMTRVQLRPDEERRARHLARWAVTDAGTPATTNLAEGVIRS